MALQDILRPYESHPPVDSFFIYRVQQNKQKYVQSSGLTTDTGASSTMGIGNKENLLSSLNFYMYRIERKAWYL
jgi:hypothetical protein